MCIHILWPNWTKIVTLNGNSDEIVTLHTHLWAKWTKTATSNANTKRIVTLHTCYGQIEEKSLL